MITLQCLNIVLTDNFIKSVRRVSLSIKNLVVLLVRVTSPGPNSFPCSSTSSTSTIPALQSVSLRNCTRHYVVTGSHGIFLTSRTGFGRRYLVSPLYDFLCMKSRGFCRLKPASWFSVWKIGGEESGVSRSLYDWLKHSKASQSGGLVFGGSLRSILSSGPASQSGKLCRKSSSTASKCENML